MENLSVIIPIHEYNEEIEKYLDRAIESIEEQVDTLNINIVIVGEESVLNQLKPQKNNITLLKNSGKTDYCSQVNFAVKQIKTKYFSILELDDFYSKTWFKNVCSHMEHNPNFTAFLPIVKLVDTNEKELGTINEVVWARAFSEELGVIDSTTLENYFDFVTTGGVFRVDEFIECGMLKPSIKLSFWYEYLLRSIENGTKYFVIPKIGYNHVMGRNNSLMESYNDMDGEERMWWINLAKKEYFFKKDRTEKSVYIKE